MNNFVILLLISIAVCVSSKPMKDVTTTQTPEDIDLDLFLGAMGDGRFANMEVDGVETLTPKKYEKLPGMKKSMKPEFVEKSDIGVVPEFTGSFISDKTTDKTTTTSTSSDESSDIDYFGEASGPSGSAASGPVTNPASTYLEGGDFEKMEQPKCQMLGCTGSIPNDGSYAMLSTNIDEKACNQIFVPMNGCTDNKGYPMGMLCSICCDCANSFITEMKKTFGYKKNLSTSIFSS